MNSELEMLHNDDILRSVVIGSGLATKSSWLSSFRNKSREIKIEKAVERLAGTLNVQPVRKSRVITISYSSHEASLSAAVLRELAGAYVKKHTEMRRPSGQQTFFESQMNTSFARNVIRGEPERRLYLPRRLTCTAGCPRMRGAWTCSSLRANS